MNQQYQRERSSYQAASMFFRAWLVESPPQSLNRKGLGLPEICPERKLNVKILSPSKSTSPEISLKEEPGLEWLHQAFTTFTRIHRAVARREMPNVFWFFALNRFGLFQVFKIFRQFAASVLDSKKENPPHHSTSPSHPQSATYFAGGTAFGSGVASLFLWQVQGGVRSTWDLVTMEKKVPKILSPKHPKKKNSSRILEWIFVAILSPSQIKKPPDSVGMFSSLGATIGGSPPTVSSIRLTGTSGCAAWAKRIDPHS